MSRTLIPVILAGGKGERFWPLSRKQRPKQFLSLDGSGKSLLQATAERLLELGNGWDDLWVVTSEMLASGVRETVAAVTTGEFAGGTGGPGYCASGGLDCYRNCQALR